MAQITQIGHALHEIMGLAENADDAERALRCKDKVTQKTRKSQKGLLRCKE